MLAAWFLWVPAPAPPPGVLAADPPRQRATSASPIEHAGYTLDPVADFEVRARVLGRRIYRHDRGSTLAPVDLALGWGAMSDSDVLADIRITQSNRFYFWSVRSFPIPRRAIERQSANMHLIPADSEVLQVLHQARPGDVVELIGTLVDATGSDGWRWRTSRTRADTGRGACELIYVTAASIAAGPA